VFAFDCLEEIRPLTRPEFNFKTIVKSHHEHLLKLLSTYWKQRYTVRGILVGEENSKFFHAMASERMRRNSISSLTAPDGTVCSDHTQMAELLWNSFKGRMGVSHEVNMLFDLAGLIQPVLGLEELSVPFTKEEIDTVIKELPVDRAPGPDGFNGFFLKKC